MTTTYLKPIYDGRKSFYDKAAVTIEGDTITLRSYGTIVCTLKGREIILDPDITYTQTTIRHLKEFLMQNNYPENIVGQVLKAIKEF